MNAVLTQGNFAGGPVRVSRAMPFAERLDARTLRMHAPAKLNLDLRVGPRGSDGFHAIDSIVAKITLYDVVTLRLTGAEGGVSLECAGHDCGPAEDNLAVRAARALFRRLGSREGLAIRLDKQIPPGAGLGGGSSDAAAVLAGLNQLPAAQASPGPRLTAEALASLAADLGADVPLFLGPPCLRMTGRGERIEPVSISPFTAILCLTPHACPTADVYRRFDEMFQRDACPHGALAPRPKGWRERLAGPPSAWRDEMPNDLGPPARTVCPPLADIWDRLSAAARVPMQLTGSGSALFRLCDGPPEAAALANSLPPDIRERCVLASANPW